MRDAMIAKAKRALHAIRLDLANAKGEPYLMSDPRFDAVEAALSADREGALEDVLAERRRQDAKWGGPKHDDRHTAQEWCCILAEHAGHFSGLTIGRASLSVLRAEAIQVAAVAVAIIQSIDRALSNSGEQTKGGEQS